MTTSLYSIHLPQSKSTCESKFCWNFQMHLFCKCGKRDKEVADQAGSRALVASKLNDLIVSVRAGTHDVFQRNFFSLKSDSRNLILQFLAPLTRTLIHLALICDHYVIFFRWNSDFLAKNSRSLPFVLFQRQIQKLQDGIATWPHFHGMWLELTLGGRVCGITVAVDLMKNYRWTGEDGIALRCLFPCFDSLANRCCRGWSARRRLQPD